MEILSINGSFFRRLALWHPTFYQGNMKVTVEISDSDLKEIFYFTGERKKVPAIRKLVVGALMMKRREKIAGKFIFGQWGVELKEFEASRAADRKTAAARARQFITTRSG